MSSRPSWTVSEKYRTDRQPSDELTSRQSRNALQTGQRREASTSSSSCLDVSFMSRTLPCPPIETYLKLAISNENWLLLVPISLCSRVLSGPSRYIPLSPQPLSNN